ncbi:BREX-1 system adenine-specific DNA-methyltransferase PglX [Methylolobus aquaticus]
MPFDQPTRRLLEKFVTEARNLLVAEFTRQLQNDYGLDPVSGTLTAIEQLGDIDDARRGTAQVLRQIVEHYRKSNPGGSDLDALDRLLREQSFTVLNRLAAVRMAEARGLIVESVAKGFESKAFRLYSQLAGPALGDTAERYHRFLLSLFDELSLNLPVLFDRYSRQGRLFPREGALMALFQLLGAPAIEPLWAEDETIGWIYQYYNDPAERKKMRNASSAPRSSRELAVRNQFFTPRYVVEFLTDNTLGRLWYEMTRGGTALGERCRYLVRRPTEIFLQPGDAEREAATSSEASAAENLSQDELLRQPVYIPYRPLKDPREVRLLDPACGSMHFGLYAFDLFTVIYGEAWEIAQRPDDAANSHETFAPFVAFAASFSDKDAFLREVPRLIIEYNLHGIDIDPRAVQIAGLSLWLRAQRAWHEAGVAPANRPRITRSNIVCAEPMPGEKELLREFVEQQFPAGERPAFAFLLEKIFERMTLAGEAGSLLRIEEEIRTAIVEARALAHSQSAPRQTQLFPVNELPAQAQFDLRGLNDEQFWQKAEQRIYDALEAYAEQAENGGGFQRRLFADDAAQGFAFIDVCRKRYDVVVMNPPFGLMGATTYRYAVSQYPNAYSDFGIAFMDRGLGLGDKCVLVGAITSRSYLSVKDAEKFRSMVAIPGLRVVADLGLDVMDGAWVDSTAQVFSGLTTQQFIQFIKVRGESLTPEVLRDERRYVFRLRSAFYSVPKSRLSYELDSGLEDVLSSGSDGLEESGICVSRTGGKTFDDERFRRVWWEVTPDYIGKQKTWCFVAQSSEFNLFYYPYYNIVKWAGNGDELGERNRQVNGQTAQARQGESFFFKPGLSFSRRGEPSIAFRTHPTSCMFSSNGPVVLPTNPHDALYLLGFLNSSWVRAAIHTQAHKFSYTVGHTKAVAWIAPEEDSREVISESSKRILTMKRSRFRMDERDNNFVIPFVPNALSLETLFKEFVNSCNRMHAEMVHELMCIDGAVARTHSLGASGIDLSRYSISVEDVADPSDIPFPSATDFAGSVSGYFIGAAFGRWDIRYATGERPMPELPDPFAPLPVCPPGMLQGDDGLPLSPEAGRRLRAEGSYPLDVAWDGILVDDPEHPLDLERRVRDALAVVWGDRADALEQEACELLGVTSLRDWFRRPAGFFADHLKRYSKSRRQAPIYWPLSIASGGYTLWIYYHRLTDQTLFTAVNDFVDPKLDNVSKQLAGLRQKPVRTKSEERNLEGLADLQAELQDFRNELLRFAQLPWKPNLNDGVQITAAPLWKLFRLSKWQKTLKETWQKLEKGDYDWAHLAYTLWPGRVRDQCKADKSLAIAHDLEELYEAPPKPAKRNRQRGPAVEDAQD